MDQEIILKMDQLKDNLTSYDEEKKIQISNIMDMIINSNGENNDFVKYLFAGWIFYKK